LIGQKLNEALRNGLYLGHAIIIWSGAIWQIMHVFTYQSAQDITHFWVTCLLIAELLALPRALSSPYKVWKICHIGGVALLAILLVGVFKYN